MTSASVENIAGSAPEFRQCGHAHEYKTVSSLMVAALADRGLSAAIELFDGVHR